LRSQVAVHIGSLSSYSPIFIILLTVKHWSHIS